MIKAPTPLVRIRPPGTWEALALREVWEYRGLLRALAIRDLKLRYRQTALGVLWVLLQPLLGAGILAFVFGRVARLDSGGVPYFIFAYPGMLVWGLFSSIVSKASTSLVSHAPLISKVAFPRLVLPISCVFSSLVDFGIGLLAGLVLFPCFGVELSRNLILLPFWLLLATSLALGIGLIAASLAVAFRDVIHILPVGLQLLLYGSPVGYGLAAIPPGFAGTLVAMNPLSPILEGVRHSFLHGGQSHPESVIYGSAFVVITLVVGLLVFRWREREFADVI